jgi:hypothetical protein
MANMTLYEYSKQPSLKPLEKGVIQMFASVSDLLRVLPFEDAPGGAVLYDRQAELPAVAFRGINEAYVPSVGALNPMVDPCVIAGGELTVDTFLVTTRGDAVRANQAAMKIAALAADWSLKFIKGDAGSNPRELTGLQTRLTGAQVISAGTTAGGAALSLAKFEEAIDATFRPTHILMSKAMRRRFTAAARDTTVGGYITTLKDEFGRPVTAFNNLPILPLEGADGGDTILPFSEAADSGSATASSIYIVSFGPATLTGIQTGPMQVTKLNNGGQMESKPAYGVRVEWFAGMALYHGRAATRLRHIGNLAIVK